MQISQFSLTKKLVINNFFYLIPISVCMMLIFSGFSKEINFAQKEIDGLLVEDLALRTLSLALVNDLGQFSENARKLIEIKKLNTENLGLSKKVLEKKNKGQLSEENFNQILRSIQKDDNEIGNGITYLNDLISYVGDSSNLILDPDLDTYYIMDSIIVGGPAFLGRLHESKKIAVNIIESNTPMSIKDHIELNILINGLEARDIQKLSGNYDIAKNEDANFGGVNNLLQSEVSVSLNLLKKSLESYIAILKQIDKGEKISEGEVEKAYQETVKVLSLFLSKNAISLNQMLNTRIDGIKSIRIKSMAIGILSVLFALAFSFFISKNMNENLLSLVSMLKKSSLEVEKGAIEGLEASELLSSTVQEQSSSLQEISVTTEEISRMALRNNETVKKSRVVTEETLASVQNLRESFEELSKAIGEVDEINKQILIRSDVNSKKFESILTIMSKISEKTQIIHEIVFQTKLLSFNASVEAARAGEHGKGFAVVAEEVGALAVKSGAAAQEIGNLLNSSLEEVKKLTAEADKDINNVINDSAKSVSSAIGILNHCQFANNHVLVNGQKIGEMINEIIMASDEQSRGVMEITKAICQFDQITLKNSELASDINSSANKLSEKSKELNIVTRNLGLIAGVRPLNNNEMV